MVIIWVAPVSPVMVLKPLWNNVAKNIPNTFHYFRAKYFPSFRNFASTVLDTVTQPECITLQETFNTDNEPATNNYSQNKLLSFARLPKNI